MTEHLTPAEVNEAMVGDESVFTMAARQKLIEDIMKLADQRLSLEREIKAFLPTKFIQSYEGLVSMSLGVGKDYRLNPDMLEGVKDGGKGFKSGDGGLRDQAAADYRRNVDRHLRLIARKVEAWKKADPSGRLALAIPVRCPRCAKFCDQDWNNCAWCGQAFTQGE